MDDDGHGNANWHKEIFGKKTSDEEIKALQGSLRRMKIRFDEKVQEERQYRFDLAERLRKQEKIIYLTMQIGLIALSVFGFYLCSNYWKNGEIFNFISVVVAGIVLIFIIRGIEKS